MNHGGSSLEANKIQLVIDENMMSQGVVSDLTGLRKDQMPRTDNMESFLGKLDERISLLRVIRRGERKDQIIYAMPRGGFVTPTSRIRHGLTSDNYDYCG